MTITGDNEFARRQALSRLVSEFTVAEGDLALERLDGEEADFARLMEAVVSVPFLANKKMVILAAPSKNKEVNERITELLEAVPDTTDLVFYEPKFDKRSGLYKALKKQADFREFTELDFPALTRWLIEEAKRRGAELKQPDARYLIERVGQNQQLLASEIEKLSLANPVISKDQITELTEAAPQSSIFQLLDAALAGNAGRAVKLYDEQRSMKVEPQQIIGMFAWQLHIMALVKAAGERGADQIAGQAKISPYVVGKTKALVGGLTLSRLREIIDELLSIDRRGKRQNLDLDAALKLFIIDLAQ